MKCKNRWEEDKINLETLLTTKQNEISMLHVELDSYKRRCRALKKRIEGLTRDDTNTAEIDTLVGDSFHEDIDEILGAFHSHNAEQLKLAHKKIAEQ